MSAKTTIKVRERAVETCSDVARNSEEGRSEVLVTGRNHFGFFPPLLYSSLLLVESHFQSLSGPLGAYLSVF